jgi:hypothetical protein
MDLINGTKDPVNKVLWDEAKADRAAGGFTLVSSVLSAVAYILKGAPLAVDYATRVANVVKSATVIDGGSATVTRVSKGSAFKVGDVISQAVGEIAVAITAIDSSNAAYDAFTHSTVTTAFTADNVIFEADAAGATSAYLLTANALLSDNVKVATATGSTTVSAIIGALEIQEANLPYPISAAVKTALTSRFQFV